MNEFIRLQLDETTLGARRLASVRPSDVQAWAAGLAGRYAPATVRGHVGRLKAVYAAAVLDRLVASSPVVRVALPRAESARVVPLTVAQVRALAGGVPPRCRAMVLVQAGLGLRLGELLALRASNVDFLRRTVRVEHQLEERTRERVEPKTPRSRRTVPLPDVAAEALAEHMRQWPPLADGSLFYGHNRRVYARTVYMTKVFKAAVLRLAAVDPTLPSATVEPRPPPPLRLGAAGRWRVGGGGRGASRPRGRDDGAQDLRAPHAGQRGPHPPGR